MQLGLPRDLRRLNLGRIATALLLLGMLLQSGMKKSSALACLGLFAAMFALAGFYVHMHHRDVLDDLGHVGLGRWGVLRPRRAGEGREREGHLRERLG